MKNATKDFQKQADKSFTITATIPASDIQHEYQHVLGHASEHVDIKGFRKGKAPADVIEAHLDPMKLLEQVAENLISEIYAAKIKEYDLKPIIQPQIKVLNPPISKDTDWQIEITGCELPEIALGDLEEKVKKINTTAPKKAAKNETKEDTKKTEKPESEKKLDSIFDTILSTAKVTLPPILVDADVQSRLSQLVDQVNQAGISVASYLKTKNTTVEKYQEEVKAQVVKEWTLNLAIDKIATDHKIEVEQKEIEEMASKNPQVTSNINMLVYVMRQQKVIEFLQNLK